MIVQSNNFNIKHIADSGQCFRMNHKVNNTYTLIAYGHYLELTQIAEDLVEFHCQDEDYHCIWKDYFDLDYDYNRIVEFLQRGEDEFLKNAAAYGWGLRILKQDIFETLITFIISQRKSIPSIKKCIEEISIRFGEKMSTTAGGGEYYYSFPSPEKLSSASLLELREAGLGYRDVYIHNTARAVYNKEIDLQSLKSMNFEASLKELMNLSGVGIKVANCVSLFGLHHIDAFPIDVWIERVLDDIYDKSFNIELYKGYAGIVQQYMFYYIRNKTPENNTKTKRKGLTS